MIVSPSTSLLLVGRFHEKKLNFQPTSGHVWPSSGGITACRCYNSRCLALYGYNKRCMGNDRATFGTGLVEILVVPMHQMSYGRIEHIFRYTNRILSEDCKGYETSEGSIKYEGLAQFQQNTSIRKNIKCTELLYMIKSTLSLVVILLPM